jgi:polysaccharide export outer membrane protein
MRYLKFPAFFFALLTALTASALAQEPRQLPSAIDVQTIGALPLQRVGTQDLLGLQVYDAPEFTRSVRVADDGTIRLPMLQSTIPVQGRLPNEIEILIAEALQREKLFVDPFVTVNVLEYHSRPISVNGAVKTPAIFQAIGTVTLLDALARAGGMTDMAGGEIVITRPNGDSGEQSVQRVPARVLLAGTDPQLNLRPTGGEEIRVPEVGKVVVWGNVSKSGVYPVLDGGASTVTTAIAQAEGLTHFSAHEAYIYRVDDQGVKHEIKVDLLNIMKRKSPDVTLMARDVLYVPDSTGRRLAAQTLDRLSGFASNTASGVLIYRPPH